jgi:hypothetical protein
MDSRKLNSSDTLTDTEVRVLTIISDEPEL